MLKDLEFTTKEIILKMKQGHKKKISKYKSLIKFEKNHKTKLGDTDNVGSLVRKQSDAMQQLKITPYLRKIRTLSVNKKRLKKNFPYNNFNKIIKLKFPIPFKSNQDISKLRLSNKLQKLMRNYETTIEETQKSLKQIY